MSNPTEMKMKLALHLLAGLLFLNVNAFSQDTNRFVFLCFGQSNMEGFPGIEQQDQGPVDERFQVLAAVDFPKQGRTKGHWYPALPPLCRPSAGLCPADYFGRTLVSNLPPHIKVGVVNVSIGGCKIELFEKDTFQSYAATAPKWMTNTIATYSGNPYQHLVEMAKLAQKDGVIRGILLRQGESNTNDKDWPNKVKGTGVGTKAGHGGTPPKVFEACQPGKVLLSVHALETLPKESKSCVYGEPEL